MGSSPSQNHSDATAHNQLSTETKDFKPWDEWQDSSLAQVEGSSYVLQSSSTWFACIAWGWCCLNASIQKEWPRVREGHHTGSIHTKSRRWVESIDSTVVTCEDRQNHDESIPTTIPLRTLRHITCKQHSALQPRIMSLALAVISCEEADSPESRKC